MRSIYWKIFITFWLTSLLVMLSTAWITSELTKRSASPAHEKIFMDSYATAAVATYTSGKLEALRQWLEQAGDQRGLTLFLLSQQGKIIGNEKVPSNVKQLALDFANDKLRDGLLKKGSLLISHEIKTTQQQVYRLVAFHENMPYHTLIQVPIKDFALRFFLGFFVSGLICYLLALYLIKPLRTLRYAAQSLAQGKLQTRVGAVKGHGHDEIAQFVKEFDAMAEELEKMVRNKERLLQDISHELRSPLARLHLAIELGRSKSGSLARAEFNHMEQACDELNALIREILEFARLNQAPEKPSFCAFDLSRTIQHLIKNANFEFSHLDKQVIYTQCIQHGTIFADKRLITRSIENVLRNALHHTKKNTCVTLHVTETQDNIIITIDDEGPGVPEEHIDMIFNPFYRVDPSRTKKTGGYGLGLAIAKKAIEQHHGTISAHNNSGGGLQVQIVIPKKLVHTT